MDLICTARICKHCYVEGNTNMKIRVTWNRSDGTKPAVDMTGNPNDPHKDDHELQFAKAIAAAGVHFNNKFGEYPANGQLNATMVND